MNQESVVLARTEKSFVERNLGRLLTMPSFLLPFMLIGVWMLGIYYSLTDYDIRYGFRNYVGYQNFVYLLTQDKYFWESAWVTLRYALGCVLLEIPLGFGVAVLLDRLKGGVQNVARAIVILPICIPPIVAVMIWKVALGPTQGVVNYALQRLGLGAVDWLSDPKVALATLVGIDAWVWTPFVIIVLWGGLRSIPRVPYEAAMVDGGSQWLIFRRITLPLMQPYLMIALLFRLCDSLNSFDIIFGTTRGGPVHVTRTLAVYTYENALWWHIGYAAAMSLVAYSMTYFIAKRLLRLWPS